MALKQTNALHARCDGLQSDKEALEAQAKQENETNSSLVSENTALERINEKAIEALDDTVQFIDENANLQACCNTAEKNIHGLSISRQVGELTLEKDRIFTEAEQGRIETLVETQGVLEDMQDELNKVQDELERKDCENQNLREEIKFSEQNDRMKDTDISLLRYQQQSCNGDGVRDRELSEEASIDCGGKLIGYAWSSRATLSAITMNQDAATSSFFVDAESKAVASSAVAACSRGTDVGNSISLVPTQDSLRGEQATPTQSEGTKTIVLSDRASAKDAERRSVSAMLCHDLSFFLSIVCLSLTLVFPSVVRAEEKNKALPIKLNELYQQYLEEKYGDEEYGWEHLITYPAPPTTKNGTPFLRLHFLLSQDCFRDLFGFLTTNTERNDNNGIILRRPLGLRALLEIMGTDVHSLRGVLIRNNFTHHPDNPKLLKPAHNTRQDFKFYHPEMHAGANAALVELRNIVPSYTVIPRRQNNSDEVNFRTLFNDLCAEEDRDNRYEAALSICRQLRNLDDMETILEKLNLLGKSKSDQALMPILFHAVGLESNVQNQDAKEKLALRLVALRLDEGNGFVLQDDVYIKPYPNRFSLNRGQQTYRDAIAASASDFSQAKNMSSGKNAAMRQVREHVTHA
eukprot:scaffold1550_cov97-Skeletonema_dohrnii-CCMP3373.AAC.2